MIRHRDVLTKEHTEVSILMKFHLNVVFKKISDAFFFIDYRPCRRGANYPQSVGIYSEIYFVKYLEDTVFV